MRRAWVLAVALLVAGCASKADAPAGSTEPTPTPSSEPTPFAIAGVWSIAGEDAIGKYVGETELVPEGGAFRFTRVIRYTETTVEDGRELHWVWQGIASGDEHGLAIDVSLRRADFVKARGALARTDADKLPLAVTGLVKDEQGVFGGTFTGEGIAAEERWFERVPSGAQPIFAGVERTFTPSHPPPTSNYKNNAFALFETFHALPQVAPHASHPDFQAAVHGFHRDTTDFAFYRENPDALRVVNKIVDPISLQETLSRANAFRSTLGEKAAAFDAEMEALVDPIAHMVPAQVAAATGERYPSGDGALWTATYLASQAFRFLETGEPEARANVAETLEGLLTLQEITGDWTTFARTLRPATGAPAENWVAGAGPFAHLEWMSGGNNDMLKGLLYGYTTAWVVLCQEPGSEAQCARLRTNAKHLADDVAVAQNGINGLTSAWLAAVVSGEWSYRVEAMGHWSAQKDVVKNGNAMIYEQGIADWSGTHLNAVQYVTMELLAQHFEVATGEPSRDVIEQGVVWAHGEVADQRLTLWNLLDAGLADEPHPAALDEMRWRLREMPCPKTAAHVDLSIRADFVLSPYPALPWKNDWTVRDRTQSLRGVPVFEKFFDDYVWKSNPMGYRQDSTGLLTPSSDYLHAYWLGRHLGVVSETD